METLLSSHSIRIPCSHFLLDWAPKLGPPCPCPGAWRMQAASGDAAWGWRLHTLGSTATSQLLPTWCPFRSPWSTQTHVPPGSTQTSHLAWVPLLQLLLGTHFFFFFFNFLTLQYCIGLPYIKMNLPQVYMCSPARWNGTQRFIENTPPIPHRARSSLRCPLAHFPPLPASVQCEERALGQKQLPLPHPP